MGGLLLCSCCSVDMEGCVCYGGREEDKGWRCRRMDGRWEEDNEEGDDDVVVWEGEKVGSTRSRDPVVGSSFWMDGMESGEVGRVDRQGEGKEKMSTGCTKGMEVVRRGLQQAWLLKVMLEATMGLRCTLKVPVCEASTVAEVIRCLEKEFNLVRVILRLDGVILSTNKTLESYGIQKHDVLQAEEGTIRTLLWRSVGVGVRVAMCVPPLLSTVSQMAGPISQAPGVGLVHQAFQHGAATASAGVNTVVGITGGCFVATSAVCLAGQLANRSRFEAMMENVGDRILQ
uniref:Ubiquitin-like domain-containing protein n=1 Tax=Compsopogon caeruleus TaxID=31354 RepID=A0A7S1TF48_9RHOD|mmetsp:Transcript_17691/g.36707  ORF Transcript_17691/g.36707 Transcript_17691/m.36707 type:complete len:287 (+) Transcript_17691:99-959(+)